MSACKINGFSHMHREKPTLILPISDETVLNDKFEKNLKLANLYRITLYFTD